MKARDATAAGDAATREEVRAARRARMSVHHVPMPEAAKSRAVDAMCRHLSGVHGGVRFAVVPDDDKTVDRSTSARRRKYVDAADRAA